MSSVAALRADTASLLSTAQIAPSILAADYARLGEQLATVLEAGARVIHVDVMDGHFVPPITIGALVVEGIVDQVRDAGALLDVHLMVERPERHVAAFAAAGADVITIHAESTPHVHRVLTMVRELGCRAGLALNPATPIEQAVVACEAIDLALCMTVNPGWGGQPFIDAAVDKVAELRRRLPDRVVIEVDGGIVESTAATCRQAGATLLVAGSAVFGADDPPRAFRGLMSSIGAET